MKAREVNVETGEVVDFVLSDEEASKIISKPASYADLRAGEYPSVLDQLDMLYHGGYDAWRSAIQAVKDKYPKTGS